MTTFSEMPGRHERHYRRRLDNPLFGERAMRFDDDTLLEMQRLDHEELLAFLDELRGTVRRAVELQANEESDVVLDLKSRLDQLYEQSAGLADDHAGNQSAIADLIEVIMRNVERGAAGDPQAMQELADERVAREAHFRLLRQPLVADLLHPQSTIGPDDLVPTLLSSDSDALDAALALFDVEQLRQLYAQAVDCLQGADGSAADAAQRLGQMRDRLEQWGGGVELN
jgi:hypothetical protein